MTLKPASHSGPAGDAAHNGQPPGAALRRLVELALAAEAASVVVARRVVEDALVEREQDLRERTTFVVSELVTNAFQHAHGRVTLALYETGQGLRVEVGDDSPVFPVPRTPTVEDERGRGLVLLEALATTWGTTARPPGKVVWVELAVLPPAGS